MPAEYTHHLIAEHALSALPISVRKKLRPFLSLYFFGAQGADFCFFYKLFPRQNPNLGAYLHRKGGYSALETLRTLSHRDPQALAYSLGYITHYAVDTAFHPYVYAVSGHSRLRHTALENALDRYYRAQYPPTSESMYAEFFRAKLMDSEREKLFFLYDKITETAKLPPLSKPSFYRAVSMFNAYMPPSFYFFSQYPLRENPQAFTTNAETLLRVATDRAIELFSSFLFCVQQKIPLPRITFGKSYLTGK